MARLGYIETPYPKQQNSPQSNPYFHSLFYFMVISENWWCLGCLLFHSKFDGRTKCHLLPWNLPHFSFLPMETELSSWEGHSIQPLEPVIHGSACCFGHRNQHLRHDLQADLCTGRMLCLRCLPRWEPILGKMSQRNDCPKRTFGLRATGITGWSWHSSQPLWPRTWCWTLACLLYRKSEQN